MSSEWGAARCRVGCEDCSLKCAIIAGARDQIWARLRALLAEVAADPPAQFRLAGEIRSARGHLEEAERAFERSRRDRYWALSQEAPQTSRSTLLH